MNNAQVIQMGKKIPTAILKVIAIRMSRRKPRNRRNPESCQSPKGDPASSTITLNSQVSWRNSLGTVSGVFPPSILALFPPQKENLTVALFSATMQEALKWVKESFEEAVEDRDQESNEGVPLVPITDFANAAMDSPSFQRLLRALGIEPPVDEQESYWRIPANMLSSTIRKRVELIGDALAGKFVEEGLCSFSILSKTNLPTFLEILGTAKINIFKNLTHLF